jgi:hypothetical protein
VSVEWGSLQVQVQPARHIGSRAIVRVKRPCQFQDDSPGSREDLVRCQAGPPPPFAPLCSRTTLEMTNRHSLESVTVSMHGACSAGSRAICWMALDSKPRRAAAMCLPAALQTVVGEAVHDRIMPRSSQIQFQHHPMPNLDWTVTYPLPSMESDALSLPLVPPRDPTTK